MIQRKPFDIGPFIDFLTSEGLRHTTADLYTRYVRPGINAGVDPADLEAFESYVVKLSPADTGRPSNGVALVAEVQGAAATARRPFDRRPPVQAGRRRYG